MSDKKVDSVKAEFEIELEEAPIIQLEEIDEQEGKYEEVSITTISGEQITGRVLIKETPKKEVKTRNVTTIFTLEELIPTLEFSELGTDMYSVTSTSLSNQLLLNFFHSRVNQGSHKGITVLNGGTVRNSRISGKPSNVLENGNWYQFTIDGIDNVFYISFTITVEYNETTYSYYISNNKRVKTGGIPALIKYLKQVSFSDSEYAGKTIEVSIKDASFKGIEIVQLDANENDLILTQLQLDFIEDFVNRVSRGKNMRAMLNGIPGTGKSETIREIARRLAGITTFVIPKFNHQSDLQNILEVCTVFESCVVILDDMDLLISSRERGGNPKALGEFLAFFDGIKKNPISLLASTNDKSLVDKAAERPGRFNMTIDYDYLTAEQIVLVCNVHLPVEFQVQEIYDTLINNIDGKKAKITGAFIANLAENVIEMCEDDEEWSVADTVKFILSSYKGFYASQNAVEKSSLGFGK